MKLYKPCSAPLVHYMVYIVKGVLYVNFKTHFGRANCRIFEAILAKLITKITDVIFCTGAATGRRGTGVSDSGYTTRIPVWHPQLRRTRRLLIQPKNPTLEDCDRSPIEKTHCCPWARHGLGQVGDGNVRLKKEGLRSNLQPRMITRQPKATPKYKKPTVGSMYYCFSHYGM